MTKEQLAKIVEKFETIAIAEMYLEAEKQAITLKKYIAQQIRNGTNAETLRNTLLRDLREGGQIFGSFRSQFRATVKQEVQGANREVYMATQDEAGVELYDWVLDPAAQHCDDCLNRAEYDARTLREWEIIGTPQAGVTVCGERCRCSLVASGTFRDGLRDEAQKIYMEMKQ